MNIFMHWLSFVCKVNDWRCVLLDGSGFKIQIGDVIGGKLVTRLINYKALSFLFILRN